MQRNERAVLAVIAVATLAGCGKGSGAPAPITSANAQRVGQQLVTTVERGHGSGGGAGFAAGARRLAAPSACGTVSGDTSDPDGDGVPTGETWTYTSCSYTSGGWTTTVDGTETLSDPHPTVADHDYHFATDLQLGYASGADSESDHWVGADDGSAAAPSGWQDVETDQVDYTGSYQGQAYSGTESDALTAVYTPGSAWDPSQPPVAGTYSESGSWTDVFSGQTFTTTLSTPTPLAFDPACDTGFTAGTVTAASSDGTSVSVTWTACDQYTVSCTGSGC